MDMCVKCNVTCGLTEGRLGVGGAVETGREEQTQALTAILLKALGRGRRGRELSSELGARLQYVDTV